MPFPLTSARRTALIALLALCAALATTVRTSPAAAAVPVTIGAPEGAAVPQGFLGVSFEESALLTYAGSNPSDVNPVLVKLLRTLAPSGARIRMGGFSTDRTWWPVPGMARPRWARTVLTPRWMAVAKSLAQAVRGKLILGVNFEAASARIAQVESDAMVSHIGRGSIAALELGNEPELYPAYGWYRTANGTVVYGRPSSWDPAEGASQFLSISRSLPNVPLAGPAVGSERWSETLGSFLSTNPRVKIATLHRYPTKRCTKTTHVTAAQLLSPTSSTGLAASVAPYVAVAHAHGAALRIDELNAVSCGGEAGLSNTFATSLWSLDALFALARTGVTGINVHTTPGSVNALFQVSQSGGNWQARVEPLYDGLLTFSQAAPTGSRLLSVSGTRPEPLRVWATRTPSGQTHVVMIDTSPSAPATVVVHVKTTATRGTVSLLRASGLGATSGVTLGGIGFGPETQTGVPTGKPQTTTVRGTGSGVRTFTVKVPAHSAALLTLGCAGQTGCGTPYALEP